MKWWDQTPLSLSFLKPAFSLSCFPFKRLFNSSSLSAIRVVSSAYLRLLIFLPAILIPACASSNPAFHMMYSACKLNKQGDNIQPWHTPFPIWNQSVVLCPVLIRPEHEWVAFPFSRGSSQPWNRTQVSHIAGGFFTSWARWEDRKPYLWLHGPLSVKWCLCFLTCCCCC